MRLPDDTNRGGQQRCERHEEEKDDTGRHDRMPVRSVPRNALGDSGIGARLGRHWAPLRFFLPHLIAAKLRIRYGYMAAKSAKIQADLAINRLGLRAAARARGNSFECACCSTYTTTSHFLSLKAQKCDPTCPSPATGRSGTHSGPGNTTRQILTIHTVTHMANVAPVPTLSISMLKHGADALRSPPMRLCCCDVDCSHRVDVLALVGRRDELP